MCSTGDFLYHTHMHGTAAYLTWSGMFGMLYTGEINVAAAKADNEEARRSGVPVAGPSLVCPRANMDGHMPHTCHTDRIESLVCVCLMVGLRCSTGK